MKKILFTCLFLLCGTLFSQNYYEIPYVGTKSKLIKLSESEINSFLQKYKLPRDYLIKEKEDLGFSQNLRIPAKLSAIYKEEIPDEKDIEYNTILTDLRKRVAEYMNKSDTIPFELQLSLHSVDSNETFLNMVSYYMPLKLSEKMMLLSCGDFKRRAFELLQILNREIQYANLRLDIQNRTQHVISDEQKQYFLRQQLKSINKELGQQEGEPEKTKLKEQARNKHWSDKVKETFEKELSRLDQMHPQSDIPSANSRFTMGRIHERQFRPQTC